MALCRLITNTMAGVPTVSGTAGDRITYLDAVLVNGCNSGSCTLSQAAGVATLARTGHGFVDQQVIEVSGATPSAYNGLHRVTYVDADTVTFDIASGTASPATGTITCKTASLGWTKPYSGTNEAVYAMGSGSLGFVLHVVDTGTPQAYTALVRMAESASSISSFTDPFPTTAQVNNSSVYLTWHKSNANNSTTRATVISGDEKSFVAGTATAGSGYYFVYVGELLKADPADAFCCGMAAAYTTSLATTPNRSFPNDVSSNAFPQTLANNVAQFFLARAGDQSTKSVIGTVGNVFQLGNNQISGTTLRRPYGATYGLASYAYVSDASNLRGFPRGVFDPGMSITSLTYIDGADFGLSSGTTYVAFAAGAAGCVVLQATGELP